MPRAIHTLCARFAASLFVAMLGTAALSLPARADSAESFYKDKALTILVGVAPGGSFDLYARLTARHLGNHIPGHPNLIVKNMSGAGGLTALNYFAHVAPKDGTWLDVVPPALAVIQVLGQPGLQYDARKFNWIGRLTSITQVFYTWHTSKTKTLADLKTRQTLIAGTGPTADSTVFSNLLNELVGTKLKVIQGYNETAAAVLAMQRGEVDGVQRPWEGMKSGRERQWIAQGQINLVAQYAATRRPGLETVGSVYDLTTTDQQRRILDFFLASTRIGRSAAMAPGVPPERAAVVRKAFAEMMKDPAFLADANKLHAALTPGSAETLAAIVASIFKASPKEIAIAKKYYH